MADTTLLYNVNGWTATASAVDTGAAVQEQRFSALLIHEGRVVSAGAFDDLRTWPLALGASHAHRRRGRLPHARAH